jgi:hypothetical protein
MATDYCIKDLHVVPRIGKNGRDDQKMAAELQLRPGP